jgi:hypothetical protein
MKIATGVVALFLVAAMCAVGADKTTDEQMSSAVGTMRTINTAEVTYASIYKDRGFACALGPMGEGPVKDKYDADHAGLINESVTSGKPRKGYVYKVSCTDKTTPHKMFVSQAEPESGEGKAFCSDQSGVIRYSDDGKASTCFKSGKPLK